MSFEAQLPRRRQAVPHVLLRKVRALAFASTWVVAYLVPSAGVGQAPPAQEAADPVLQRLALTELERLSADGGDRARGELLISNLSRYFAVYLMPSSPAELERVVGTAERILQRFAAELYRAARERAAAVDSAAIEPAHAGAALAAFLPMGQTPYREVVLFPQVAEPDRVVVEVEDLQAFLDTGIPWELLLQLAFLAEEDDGAALPTTPGAGRIFAAGINTYGLLLFRLAGVHARDERAPHVKTLHLRDAAKTLSERAARSVGAPSPPVTQTAAAPPGSLFTDTTAVTGPSFRHTSSEWLARFRRYGPDAPTFSGGGVAARDVDADGRPDLIFCGGQGCALFRNEVPGRDEAPEVSSMGSGGPRFVDVTAGSGIGHAGEARMPVLADFDNDGDPDLFITYARDSNRLFRHRGGESSGIRFEDVTAASGLEVDGDISGPAVAFDFDGDGLLDIYVGNFGNYLDGEIPESPRGARNALPNRLYRNLGDLRFADVTASAGVGDTGWAQALSHVDIDRDGDQDLYIANDFGPNELYLNNGDGTFSASAALTGSADEFHGMNVSFADLNRDQRADIFITNIWFWNSIKRAADERNTLLISSGSEAAPRFVVDSSEGLLGPDSGWAWAALFFDQDNDGDDDLFVANGFTDYLTFVQMRPHPSIPDQLYPINNGGEDNLFFRNEGSVPSHLVEGSGVELPGVNSRGAATLDFDRDGDLDLAVSTFHDTGRMLRNDGAPENQGWLAVRLEGDPRRGVNRDAIGAQLIARGGDGLYVWRSVSGGEGYLGMSDPEISFGTGTVDQVDLEILWPGGEEQRLAGVAVGQRIVVRQGREGFELADR